MKVIKRILIIILLIIIFIVAGFVYKGHELYKQALEKISISDKVAEIKSDENYTKLEDMSEFYKDAVIAVEDRRFYEHGAIDPIALARAIYSNIKAKELREGGSTITQQVAKNLYFISEETVVRRKIAEMFMAIELENKYSKEDILELYINTIYFGEGYYGIKQASNGYLNKEPKDMNLAEATMMAGVPNAPSVYAPTINTELCKQRQNKVISSMVEYEYISQEQADSIDQSFIDEIYNGTYNK